jgi:hypothetical protein
MREFILRIIGAAALNPSVYEDVEADPKATAQAIGVIALGSLAAGFGANGWNAQPRPILTFSAVAGFLGLLAWASWALVTFEIGGRLLPERQTRVDVPELLRTIGFSAAPALFLVLGAFGATTVVFAITSVWMLAAMILAVSAGTGLREHGARRSGLRTGMGADRGLHHRDRPVLRSRARRMKIRPRGDFAEGL